MLTIPLGKEYTCHSIKVSSATSFWKGDGRYMKGDVDEDFNKREICIAPDAGSGKA